MQGHGITQTSGPELGSTVPAGPARDQLSNLLQNIQSYGTGASPAAGEPLESHELEQAILAATGSQLKNPDELQTLAAELRRRMMHDGIKFVVSEDELGNRVRCHLENANDTRSRGSAPGRVDDAVRISVQDELLARKRAGTLPMFGRNRGTEFIDGQVRQLSCVEWLQRYYSPWLRDGRLTQNILRLVDKNLRAAIFSYADVRGESVSKYVPAAK